MKQVVDVPHYCTTCGAEIREGVRFCPVCGTAVRARGDEGATSPGPFPNPSPRPPEAGPPASAGPLPPVTPPGPPVPVRPRDEDWRGWTDDDATAIRPPVRDPGPTSPPPREPFPGSAPRPGAPAFEPAAQTFPVGGPSLPGAPTPAPPEVLPPLDLVPRRLPSAWMPWALVALVATVCVVGLLLWRPWVPVPQPGATSATPVPAPSSDDPSDFGYPTDPPDPTDPSPTADPSTPDPDPTESATDQAAAVDELLTESAGTRRNVSVAVQHLRACGADGSDAAVLQQGTSEREDLVAQIDGLTLDELPDADRMKEDLDVAWQASADADRMYLAAYEKVKDQCSGSRLQGLSEYEQATSLSNRATGAKKDFVKVWNPIADLYGFQTWENTEI